MHEKLSIPNASALIQSMRSIGYSFESAIADIIDNSISAGANNINIFLTPGEDPQIIIFDDGCGMTNLELEIAMQYGSKNPNDVRSENDLGRFGLGLKSASLSHCKELIVVSKKYNKFSAYSWNIDHVVSTGNWVLLEYDHNEIMQLPAINLFDDVTNGTYVLWRNFDKIQESSSDVSTSLNGLMIYAREHISLVFHRFIEEGLQISLNNALIEARDPFLEKHKKTQIKREQSISVDDEKIYLKPYILPHVKYLTSEDIKKVGGKDNLRSQQGFYVYRQKRLIIWGTWFRLESKGELGKLARVKVDIPNTLDYMWKIDVKKSTASLPDKVKRQMFSAIHESYTNSERIYEYKGRKVNDLEINTVWNKIKMRDGYKYEINMGHPILKTFSDSLDDSQNKQLNEILELIEDCFPSDSHYFDTAKGILIKDEISNEKIEKHLSYAREQVNSLVNMGLSALVPKVIENLIKSEPFNNDKIASLLHKEYLSHE